jgi:hypothetical protein
MRYRCQRGSSRSSQMQTRSPPSHRPNEASHTERRRILRRSQCRCPMSGGTAPLQDGVMQTSKTDLKGITPQACMFPLATQVPYKGEGTDGKEGCANGTGGRGGRRRGGWRRRARGGSGDGGRRRRRRQGEERWSGCRPRACLSA